MVVTVVLWGVSGLLDPAAQGAGDPERVADNRLVQPGEGGSALWPYTSSAKTVTKRTLAINIIVYGSKENVRRTLTKRGELEFEPVPADEGNTSAAANDTVPANDSRASNESVLPNGTTASNGTGSVDGTDGNGTVAGEGTPTPTPGVTAAPTPTQTATPNGTETPSRPTGTFGENETVEINGTATPNATATTETPTSNETTTNATAANATAANGTATNATAANGTETNGTATPTESPDDGNDNVSQVVQIKNTGIEWRDAHGAVRYSYVDTKPGKGGGQWIEESYQLRSGPYLGSRLHVRAYASPTGEWTALQVHEDYWDWFRLRHTVPDTRESANRIESEFIGKPYVDDVSREYYGIHGGRSDGWLSVIELSSAAILLSRFPRAVALTAGGLLGVVSAETRTSAERAGRRFAREVYEKRGGIMLAAVLAGVILGVRVGGIAIETTFPEVHPKLIVALLYPLLAFGLPAIAAIGRFTRDIDPTAAFGFVVVGVGAAFVVDFGMIGVNAVPIGLVLHRTGLLIALGLIATGSAISGREGRQLSLVGATAWLVGLVWPLMDFL